MILKADQAELKIKADFLYLIQRLIEDYLSQINWS